jgi:uncharacterized protein YciI
MVQRHVVFHSPGPNWKAGGNFQEQSEDVVMEHVAHYRKFQEQGKLSLGGPYTDIDSGGMMIADESVKREELEEFAASDPAVIVGLLTFEIKTWYVAMSK